MTKWKFGIALGHNELDVNIPDLYSLLLQFTGGRLVVPIASNPSELPFRTTTLSGEEYSFGVVSGTWVFAAMPITALNYIINTYAPNISNNVTLRWLDPLTSTYSNYNATLIQPLSGRDYSLIRQLATNVTLRFNNIEVI